MLPDTGKRRVGDLLAVQPSIPIGQEDRGRVSKSQLGTQHFYFYHPLLQNRAEWVFVYFFQANVRNTKSFGKLICKVFGDESEGVGEMWLDFFRELRVMPIRLHFRYTSPVLWLDTPTKIRERRDRN